MLDGEINTVGGVRYNQVRWTVYFVFPYRDELCIRRGLVRDSQGYFVGCLCHELKKMCSITRVELRARGITDRLEIALIGPSDIERCESAACLFCCAGWPSYGVCGGKMS
ncbi:unnamed protein product [Linum trigynum]|uniref:Uncharacterized protein n=1 Tax=Linum trigynum TaxID=586398 RepID=A0AAV2D0Y0_9ROSI